jgi:uncharacterized protein YuzE
MQVSYDNEADALSIRLREAVGRVRTRRIDEQRLLDYDEHGDLVGIEILFVSRGVNLEGLPEAARIAEVMRSFPQPSAAS